MRKLLNTLFVTTEDVYLALDGENVILLKEESTLARFPLHALQSILCFTYKGASPALMGACASRAIALSLFTPRGRFLCRVSGELQGNVLLRREQYRRADNPDDSVFLAKGFLTGKLYNARWVLERATRDHALRIDTEKLKRITQYLWQELPQIQQCSSLETLRGVEGVAALQYFSGLDDLILQQKESFYFRTRSRRPPLDRCNALLSFVYTLLAHDCAGALEGAGLDPYVGFLHRDRPGRASLALDLMEELRPLLGDRFCISLINQRILRPNHFEEKENGTVLLTDEGRKVVLTNWQEKKREELRHPFLEEKIPWGLVPFVQALLLARCLRGDLDGYPPFLWK